MVRDSREWIRNRILLVLDQGPCHGYDILRSLSDDVSDLRLTTLYRWLHNMESEGLVESEIQPGPHGPNRRVYRLGSRGESRMREMLKDSIKVIMHFYDAYRRSITGHLPDILLSDLEPPSGKILYAAFPRLRDHDLTMLHHISQNNGGTAIDILGDSTSAKRTGIKHKSIKGEISDIPSPAERYSQVWLSGIPERRLLPSVVFECKRVLVPNGVLRIIAPFVFFNEPVQPNIGEFVRLTAVQLFPDLGVTEGDDMESILDASFEECGALDVFPGLVVFWAIK